MENDYHYVPPEELHPQEGIFDNRNSYSEVWLPPIDHEGRPLPELPVTKEERHDDNLSKLHGVYWHGSYYHHGIEMKNKNK